MSDHLVPVEFLRRCFNNLEAQIRPERDRLNGKRKSGEKWTVEESVFMDDEGNITDEMMLVDNYSDALDKEQFLGSLSHDQRKAYQRLISSAYPLPSPSSPPPAIISSHATHPTRSEPPTSSNSSPWPVPADFVPSMGTDDPHIPNHDAACGTPSEVGLSGSGDHAEDFTATKLTILHESLTPPRLHRHGHPYAHVGPPELSILAIPGLLEALDIGLWYDDYNVSYLLIHRLDNCDCCNAFGEDCGFLTFSVTVDNPSNPRTIYVGPCGRCACAHRPCTAEGEYKLGKTKSVAVRKRSGSETEGPHEKKTRRKSLLP